MTDPVNAERSGMHCPLCSSANVECQSSPYVHRCSDCGFDGSLEFADYVMVYGEVAKVYDHITGGRVSKPNTLATAVIGEADAFSERMVAKAIQDEKEPKCHQGSHAIYDSWADIYRCKWCGTAFVEHDDATKRVAEAAQAERERIAAALLDVETGRNDYASTDEHDDVWFDAVAVRAIVNGDE